MDRKLPCVGRVRLFKHLIFYLSGAAILCAQDETSGRASQIEAERQAKASSIQPEKPNPFLARSKEAFANAFHIWNFSHTGSHGLSLRLGGLPSRSGFALGPDYALKHGDLYDPDFIWDTYAVGSLQGYYRVQSGVELPRLLNDRAFFSMDALRFDYPRLSYYGAGPDSRIGGRTDYRVQNNRGELRGGLKISGHVQVGLVGAFQNIKILRGTDNGIAQTAANYAVSPGANFVSGGFFVRYDGRDTPLAPHSGSYFLAQFQNIDSPGNTLGGFNQYDLEAQHYFHYWNQRRVIALRLKSTLTTPHSGSTVPFYLEPTLGGSDDLRGFRPYRFYDRNAVVATAEYRWTAMEKLDMALFADAGKVYHDATTFSLSRMQADMGLGLRARIGDNVPLRIDIGCGREGVQLWITFFNVF